VLHTEPPELAALGHRPLIGSNLDHTIGASRMCRALLFRARVSPCTGEVIDAVPHE
jgi:hypothetical protein